MLGRGALLFEEAWERATWSSSVKLKRDTKAEVWLLSGTIEQETGTSQMPGMVVNVHTCSLPVCSPEPQTVVLVGMSDPGKPLCW